MRLHLLTISAVSTLLAGCSGGWSGLTTGAIGKEPPPKVQPATPNDRAFAAGVLGARAQKCGYNFDPARHRYGYLAYEQGQGIDQNGLNSLAAVYDRSRAAMLKQLSPQDEYCSDERTTVIKNDLTKHLAGDYSVPDRRLAEEGGLFAGLQSSGKETFNKNFVNDPTWEKKTTRTSE